MAMAVPVAATTPSTTDAFGDALRASRLPFAVLGVPGIWSNGRLGVANSRDSILLFFQSGLDALSVHASFKLVECLASLAIEEEASFMFWV